jgi:Fic family protein
MTAARNGEGDVVSIICYILSMLTALIDSVEQKKAQLDRARPLSAAVLVQLQKHYDIELTYTSNAIEGNTLTLRETAEVIEHGITVGGKSLRDHLEAVDHYEAVQWMRELATLTAPIGESTVCELHQRIVARSQPAIAGIYSQIPRRIAGSPVVFPNPAKIPHLMVAFDAWLKTAPPDPAVVFEAHFRLTAIHPFDDGNGPHGAALDESLADPWRLSAGRRAARRPQNLSRRSGARFTHRGFAAVPDFHARAAGRDLAGSI